MIDILLIEDDPSAGYALAKYLTFKGYAIVVATTVAEGVAQLHRMPAVAIVDMMLPDRPGEWLLDILRDQCPRTDVIAWTAMGDGDRLEAIRARGVKVVRKPATDLDDLIGLLPPPRGVVIEGGGL